MAKYHIKANGEPGKCSAFLRPCPLGASAEEHYASPGEARQAYEKQMDDEKLASWAKEDERMRDERAERTARQLAWAESFKADFDAVATPAVLASWREEEPNSLKWTLARLRSAHQRGEYDAYDFANLAGSTAAGAKAGSSQRLRQSAHDLTFLRAQEAQAQAYEELLKELPLEGRGNGVDYPNPFRQEHIDGRRLKSEVEYVATMEKSKADLAFAERFARPWYDLLKAMQEDRAEGLN